MERSAIPGRSQVVRGFLSGLPGVRNLHFGPLLFAVDPKLPGAVEGNLQRLPVKRNFGGLRARRGNGRQRRSSQEGASGFVSHASPFMV